MNPLTNPQKLIYNMEKYAGGTIAVICGSVLFEGKVDIEQLNAAANEIFRDRGVFCVNSLTGTKIRYVYTKFSAVSIFRLNEALRTRIYEADGKTYQEIVPYEEKNINVLRFHFAAQLHAYAKEYAKVPVLLKGDLCEIQSIFTENHYGLLAKCHHLISDAWTLTLIASQLASILSGEEPPAFPYSDYAENEIAYIQSSRYSKDRAFFIEQFKKCDEVTYLSEKSGDSYSAQRATFYIDTDHTAKIRSYSKQCDVSPFVLFLTAFSIYCSRVKMNVPRFYIGTPILNRYNFKEKNTMGMFINTVPVLVDVDYSKSFSENLESMKAVAFSILRHQKFHYNDLLTAIRQEYGFTEKLYDVILSYQNAAVTGASSKFETTWYHSGSQVESLQIHIDDRDCEGIFRIHFDFRNDKFTFQEIERMYANFLNLLMDAITNDYKKPDELELLSANEKRQLLQFFNNTAIDYPRDKCVHTLFEEQVSKTPNESAVVACDRTLTYRELNEQANRIAHGLIDQGVKPGDLVAFALPRRSYLIAAMFGILKAGAAYLPIDLDYPQERIKYILEDSKAAYFVTEANIQELLKNPNIFNPMTGVTSDSLCYCIYTSGSTGNPKGTLLTHRNVGNYVNNCNKNVVNAVIQDSYKTIVSIASIGFDMFTTESMLSSVNGMTILLANEEQAKIQTALNKFLSQNPADVLQTTPTKMRILMADPSKCGYLKSLKAIMLGGEIVDAILVSDLMKLTTAHIFDMYGPTESTVWSSGAEILSVSDITIGKPIANTQIYIVDKYMRPVPIGVIGELCIAGDGVGMGYLNHPELTAEKFINNSFGKGKLYKTGDLAYWREDGNIVYVGRNDFQVKIRGLRIELGEIENALQEVEGISQAVVVVRKNESGRQLICAFYTGKETDGKILRAAIGQKLPQYMLPHIFTYLDALPLTSSGKVNQRNLPDVDLSEIAAITEYTAPETKQEIVLCAAVQTVLRVEKVGTSDNFFDLGGDSLKAIELIAALEPAGYSTGVKNIFDFDTLGELAKHLTAAEAEQETIIPAGPVPASDAQVRVYTAQAMAGGTAYNVPYVFQVKHLDSARLQAAVSELTARHESLRTRFETRDGQIMQIIENSVDCTVEALNSADISAFIRPFDLETAPLLRVGYYQNTIMIDMHHIITDGGSMPVFMRELNDLYMGRSLGEKPVQYREFAIQKRDDTRAEQYWLSVFSNEPSVLEMNTDYPRQSKQTFSGAALYEALPGSLHARICEKCKTMGITPYAYYIGAFYILLSKFSGNEDIVVGIPASGRSGKFLNSIGMFVNTLALRGRPEGAKSTVAFLREIRDMTIQALDHQEYPYGNLVKRLNIHPENRNPLFDVMFAYQSEKIADVIFGDEPAELVPAPVTTSKYDITFNILPRQEDVVLVAEYCIDLYEERTIRRLMDGYQLILTQMLDSGNRIKDISVVTDTERQRLLYEFNDTAVDYPRDKCVHTLFEEQAAKTPDKTAVIACDQTLTYQELNEQANKIAHDLIAHGVNRGDIVAFALPRRSYLIAAMFGILKAGAAYLPIDPDYPKNRIDYLINESNAKLCLTENNIERFFTNNHKSDCEISVNGNDIFCALHTSGSTGIPKLSLLQHGNLNNFVFSHKKFWGNIDTVVSATIVTFDAFIMDSVLSVAQGYRLVLASEEDIYNQLSFESLFRYSEYNMFFSTPTKIESYLDNSQTKSFLQHIQNLVIGGEPFSNRLLDKLKKYAPSCRIFNIYGPTETTICATVNDVKPEQIITIGNPVANAQIYIVDKYMRPVPIGVIGELCIAGDGVGAGYLNRPELTAEKFIDNPFGKGKLYKTGDLAYWREDGNIVYVGRNDFQVKIRGLRIELGEIENAIQEVEGVSQAVAVVRKNEASRQFICAFYTGREIPAKEFRSIIGQKLPKYMIPHSFIHLEALPLTGSGKVNRKALPEVNLNSTSVEEEYVVPKTEREIALCVAVQTVLHIERVGTADNFFDLGGDSLKAIELIAVLEQDGYSTKVKNVFDSDTLGELAKHLTAAEAEQETAVLTGPVPATDAQVRVYTAQAMAGGTAYNVPYVFQVKRLDPARLQAAVSELTARHESFRTRFENRDGQIMQIVEDSANCIVEALDSGDIAAFIRPFDLETAPLLRVGYYQNVVMFDMHHIITDGGSMPVFLRELNELYMGRHLDRKPAQYREFAVRAHDYTQSGQYWLSVYADEPPILELNTDHPRQNKQTFSGAVLYESLPASFHARICEECRIMEITPYAFYMGAFYVLLSKFSGNEDIVVGVPASGRSGRFLSAIGMFVNTLALRGRPEGDKTTGAFLREIREMTIQALDHQEYPYGNLVKKLDIHTENRNPLFDVMFAYQSEKMADVIFGDEPAELLPAPVTTSKYDITFNVLPRQEDVVLVAEYCVDLYEEQTIRRLMDGYKLILKQMLDSGKLLKDISAVTDTERRRLLYEFNDTAVDYPMDKCVHTLFEEQAAKTPDRTAVVACDRTLTYQELNEQANRIAHGLIEKGVKQKDIIAFALPRRSYLITAMFGILKAGAAYLPIDPDYPRDRINYMLEDSKAAYFITEANIQELLTNENTDAPMISMGSDSLCYCIYTSGSTGKPKGTLLTHKNIGNYVSRNKNNVIDRIIQNDYQSIVSVTTVGFDIFVTESILPLTHGMTVLFANEDQAKIQSKLNSFMMRNRADVMQTTPTKMCSLIGDSSKCEYLKSLKAIILGGEAVDAALISELRGFTSAHIFDIYGPTETTVWSTNAEILSPDEITIGKPIANTQVYIVDKYTQPVPLRVTGELCIAGDGVGAGYLNRPELTAEKFIDNPFGGGKLYRTGDLAYWRTDGNIVYVGRNDFQVKIRGLRIELGEIENAIQCVEGITRAVAVVRKDNKGRQLICAFYTGEKLESRILRAAIGQKLPKYMAPHIFTHLDEMPLTSSGKVNRKTLPEVDLSMVSSAVEYVAPVGEMEKRLAALMEQTLNYSPIGRNDDFFDLGGDSLKAIEFLSKAHGEEIYFDLQNVFDYPTVETLCGYLQSEPEKRNAFTPEQFAKYAPVLERNVWDEKVIPECHKLGTVFLTGGTGFLGSHILDTLRKHGVQKIYCLVRGGKERLAQRLQYYFGEQYVDEIGRTIIPVVGDLESETDGSGWPEQVDYVIHAAASVKHYGTWQYFKQANVDATARVLTYAQKINAKLVYISTVSVSGNSMADQFDGYVSEDEKHFYESSLYIGQSLDNVYVRSKFEAETLVLDAMCQGFCANIIRMGNLTNRAFDMKFQPNYNENAFLKRVKAILDLGCLPEYPSSAYVEFTPVDAAAEAVVKIMEYMNDRHTVFHVNSNRNLYYGKMLKYLAQAGHPLTVLPSAEFARRIRATLRSPQKHIFQALSNHLNQDDVLQFDSNIHIENNFTVRYLRSVGFEWPEIDYAYIEGYLRYFEELGYIGGLTDDVE